MNDFVSSKPTLFTTTWCPHCSRLKAGLDGVDYIEIDVEENDAAAEFVKSVNNGNRVVPTVLFSDGSTLTNPPASDVISRTS